MAKAQTDMGEITKALHTYSMKHDENYPPMLTHGSPYFGGALPTDP